MAQDQPTVEAQVKVMAREPSLFSSSNPSAGIIPTNPAARGIYRKRI
jgi:hypothetical protein